MDLRGFGWTDRPEGEDYSPQAQAALILALLNERGVTEPFDVVAHSWAVGCVGVGAGCAAAGEARFCMMRGCTRIKYPHFLSG